MRALALPLLALLASSVHHVASTSLPDDPASLPVSHLVDLASTLLAEGNPVDALHLYDEVLHRDPDDFSTLYKRATVRLAQGHYLKAKDAFHDVLRVRDYAPARLALAKIHAKLGEYKQAKQQVDLYLKDPSSKDLDEANQLRSQVVAAERDVATAKKALSSNPPHAERCIASLTAAIALSPQSADLRTLRAECLVAAREFDSAVADLSRASAVSPALATHLQLRTALVSSLFVDHGKAVPAESLLALKKCLQSDPDSKPCRKLFKALKHVEKDLAKLRNWLDADRWTEVAVLLAGSSTKDGLVQVVKDLVALYQAPLDPSDPSTAPLPPSTSTSTSTSASRPDLARSSPLLTSLLSTLCHAYVSLENPRKASKACAEVLSHDPEDVWGLVGSADQLVKDEQWEDAVRVLSDAFEKTGRSDRVVLARLQKAQRLLKQSKQKDYYKILGVARDADAKTIKRAYRKATLKAHPDKEGGSEEKMAALNQAYEVLSNPELRARFDHGEDPNDPAAQQGGSPFGGGGFGGGGGHPFFFQQGGGGGFGGGGSAGGGGQPFHQFFQGGGGGGGHQFNFRWG
ncbi:hypothetical protein JCM10212_004913 [Sporobolomyces blumeae]